MEIIVDIRFNFKFHSCSTKAFWARPEFGFLAMANLPRQVEVPPEHIPPLRTLVSGSVFLLT
jgi:hypothetical protein